jgi:hypothetical protein
MRVYRADQPLNIGESPDLWLCVMFISPFSLRQTLAVTNPRVCSAQTLQLRSFVTNSFVHQAHLVTMPGLGDIRGHVRRGLKLKPSTPSGRDKHRVGGGGSDLFVEVGSIDEREGNVNKPAVAKNKVEEDNPIDNWKYQNTELYK